MVVGVDTYHDATKRGQSVAGLVCSLNKTFTRYSSHVNMQVTEMATAIKPMLIGAVSFAILEILYCICLVLL